MHTVYLNAEHVTHNTLVQCLTKTHSQVGGWDTHTHTHAVMKAGEIGENYTVENVCSISTPAVCAQINPRPLLEQMNYCFLLCVQQHSD